MRPRTLGFQTDLMVRRLAGSEIFEHGDHMVIRSPSAPNFYWGNFLLLAGVCEIEAADRWVGEFSRYFPSAGHVAIGWDRRSPKTMDRLRPLRELGLELETNLVMTAEELSGSPDPALPAERRQLSSGRDWMALETLELELWGSASLNSAAHLDFVRSRVDECRRLTEAGHGAYFGCFEGDRIISTAGVVVARGVGRFQNVETSSDRRRLGLAGSMVKLAATFAKQRLGASRLVIVADPDGPAIDLYRKLGFREREHQLTLLRASA
jgi:ribosomal protein S18 acetylase RimI-like enzyme